MILTDEEIKDRIESPLNLLNRLRSTTGGKSVHSQHPALPPKSGDIISNLEDKIANSGTRSKAASIMSAAMDELRARLPEVQRPEKLAQIAREMSQVVSNHDNKPNTGNSIGQIIVYAPQVQPLDNFDIVDVVE